MLRMMHNQVQLTLEHSDSIKLLCSRNAALVISFVQRAFKAQHRTSIGLKELLEDLEHTLDTLHETRPELYPNSAQAYLTTWCDEEHRILARRYLERDEPVFELTSSTEKVLTWLDDLNRREFIGTESRFLRIFSLLEEIKVQSSADPEARLAYLEGRKAELQAEIDKIRESGVVTRYNSTQLRERFTEAHEVARQLLADFREVEENFRDIARNVQAQQLGAHTVRGSVIASVLDADAKLKASDQGRSFYAFWHFLISPEKQEELRRLVERVYTLAELSELSRDQQDLKDIEERLLTASSSIVQSNQRLAEQLRRLLDEQNLVENKRVLALIADIKNLAAQREDDGADFITLETRPDIQLVMERPLWEARDTPTFAQKVLNLGGEDLSVIDTDALYRGVYVDKHELLKRIEAALLGRSEIRLARLLEQYPVEQGLAEIIAYLSIASQSEHHQINREVQETVLITHKETATTLKMPQVVFGRSV